MVLLDMRVAVVEDEKKLAASLKEGLEAEGYAVSTFHDGLSAYQALAKTPYDLIVLDLMLPEKSGQEICYQLRQEGVLSPMLILTAKDSIEDKVTLFDLGADDFLTKPFSFDELLARMRALHRRGDYKAPLVRIAEVEIDAAARRVRRGHTEIPLTVKEFDLLAYLVRNRGVAKTREEIFADVWERGDEDFGNVVDVHIRNLRKKLGDQHNEKIIRTVRGIGYAAEE